MKISDTYKRYLEVCGEIESFSGRLTFSVADNRLPTWRVNSA